ncbi:MAG: FHA domain-containing protein [Gammaproteobacteria bacterium]|nr:FHA domain-containing protein [Gammaproteobacteria bacterium]
MFGYPLKSRYLSTIVKLLVWISFLSFSLFSLTLNSAVAELRESLLNRSIITVNAYRGKNIKNHGTGFIVQSDRFNGYVITNSHFLDGSDTTTVNVPNSGAELVAQILRNEPSYDFALLKVNGLNLPPLEFSRNLPQVGEVVWSAVKWQGDNTSVGLARGILRSSYEMAASEIVLFSHSAMLGEGSFGSVLLNECGHVIGLNMATPGLDASVRAVNVASLRSVLLSQNIKITFADGGCISEVTLAKNMADLAAVEARKAREEATKAQVLATSLEKKLQKSDRRSDSLLRQTRAAREKADAALLAAEIAQKNADVNRIELARKTASLEAEALAMKESYEKGQVESEQRFKEGLKEQQREAIFREYILIGTSLVLLIGMVVVFLVMRRRGKSTPDLAEASPIPLGQELEVKNDTEHHHEELTEFVLDGRDDEGIRYLLRISGDQLLNEDGVIIGRNPKDSPYIINHADVSRKHARMRVMKNRVFIEDLGSTNGTSVNGQSIDEKGPVSIDSGDQIIIGSVVMNLRVLSA